MLRDALKPQIHSSGSLGFDRSALSDNALGVVRILQENGYDGYLVGGCVRDLAMGHQPKDFDVTTNAHPQVLSGLFRNSRAVGRRFRIVHVIFGYGRKREIVEVSTYRTGNRDEGKQDAPTGHRSSRTGRILSDNVYGMHPAEDALRRDFSMNALYYDPCREQVFDYVGGLEAIRAGRLEMIGDVDARYAGDPVRMIRAIRFAAKLDLDVDPAICEGILRNAALLKEVSAPRLLDEIVKLFHQGVAAECWQRFSRTPMKDVLFPGAPGGAGSEVLVRMAMENTDRRISQGLPASPGFLFAVILWQGYRDRLARQLECGTRPHEAHRLSAESVIAIQSKVVSLPWRIRQFIDGVWNLQPRLERRIPSRIGRLMSDRYFRAAYDFLELRTSAGELEDSLARWWRRVQQVDGRKRKRLIEDLPSGPARSGRRSRHVGGRKKPANGAEGRGFRS